MWLNIAVPALLITMAVACVLIGATDATAQREQWQEDKGNQALDTKPNE